MARTDVHDADDHDGDEEQKRKQDKEGDGEQAAGSQKKDGQATDDKGGRPGAPSQNAFYNIFNGSFNSAATTFGTSAEDRAARGGTDGPVSETELRALTEHFIAPVGYDVALTNLQADRVVHLRGPVGIGKRSSAIHLLRDVVGGSPLFVLSPIMTLNALAERGYKEGYGYVVVDRVDEGPAADTDFAWRSLRDKVQDDRAFLVVTSSVSTGGPSDVVRFCEWERPNLRAVLLSHLHKLDGHDDAIEHILATLPEATRIRDLTTIARRIAAGQDHRSAVSDFLAASATHVSEWFGRVRGLDIAVAWDRTLDVATLSFMAGSSVPVFESAMIRLEQHMSDNVPEFAQILRKRKNNPGSGERRGDRIADDGLIGLDDVGGGVTPRQSLVFRLSSYHRQVVAELWRRRDAGFWGAIRDWLEEEIDDEPSVSIAQGLAFLASVDFDEVMHTYLEPWSDADESWSGQVTAAFTLWFMCYDDALAPAALAVATRWAVQGTPQQRWTAAVALGGELGVRYPTEATNRLWQLIIQSGDGAQDAALALAVLFANLVESQGDATKALALLDQRMKLVIDGRATARLTNLTVLTVLALLTVVDERTQQPAIIRYLRDNPDRVDLVAGLWAGVLRHHQARMDAILALWNGLRSLRRLSDNPTEDARRLGEALARQTPAAERDSLRDDLMAVEEPRWKETRTLAETVAEAIRRIRWTTVDEGQAEPTRDRDDDPEDSDDPPVPDH